MDKTAKERMRRYRQRNKAGDNVTLSPDSVTQEEGFLIPEGDSWQNHDILKLIKGTKCH